MIGENKETGNQDGNILSNKNKEETMKKIFIYYSLTGNGDLIAQTLKEKKYEIRKVKTKFRYPKTQLLKILIGGYRATFNKQDKLVNFDKNIEEFDEIVIGSPIWNDRLSAPINGVLSKINLKGKKTTFILYSGTGKAKKAEEQIKKICDAKIIHIKDPIIFKEELKKLNDKKEETEQTKEIKKSTEKKNEIKDHKKTDNKKVEIKKEEKKSTDKKAEQKEPKKKINKKVEDKKSQ